METTGPFRYLPEDATLGVTVRVDKVDLYGQLAEEAIELAKAALKLQRLEKGTNLPAIDKSKALDDLEEEVSDLYLVLETMDIFPNEKIMLAKIRRWEERLAE